MKKYKKTIALSRNARGIWSLDTIMGCKSGTVDNEKGCYGDCYAARYSKKYGFDFSNFVERGFESEKHKQSVIRKINKIDMDFIRIGTSGDPSENWQHTLDIIQQIKEIEKEIVIITKHWNKLTQEQLEKLKGFNVCINTSVSAMDKESILKNGLSEYERIKPYCKSVLRVVTCDFNKNNPDGYRFYEIQKDITEKYEFIDTIFRVSKNNPLVKNGLINTSDVKFLGKKCTISKMNKKGFFGKCEKCPDMCGINL